MIVVTRVGLGKIGIADGAICFSQDCQGLSVSSEIVNGKFALYQLSLAVQNFLFFCRGTTINGVTKKQLADTVFYLPPLPEQNRIVAKIEELFSELDKGVASLKTVQEQLKIYRQAVLQRAFEGKLTEEWRTKQAKILTPQRLLEQIKEERENCRVGSGKDLKNVDDITEEERSLLPELPICWQWKKLSFLAELTGGITKGRDFKGKSVIRLPYLRVANVQDGYLDLSDMQEIELLESEKDKYLLRTNDVLYTEGGDKDKLGRGTIWNDAIKNCVHQNHIFKARTYGQTMVPQFLAYYSQTKTAKKYFYNRAKQTVNLASINMTVLRNLPVPVSSRAEQHQIVAEIESRLSVCDKLEESIAQSLLQAEALRQSILKKAFEGKLVPQDPNDEPAEKLLARIRAERAQTKPARKIAKGRTKQ